MASRDNQSLQIIVILLAITMILLLVGLVLVNNEKKTQAERASTAENNAREAQQASNQAQGEANQYKVWMGFQEADNLETLQTAFGEDMALYGGTFDENTRFYRTILSKHLRGESQAGKE